MIFPDNSMLAPRARDCMKYSILHLEHLYTRFIHLFKV